MAAISFPCDCRAASRLQRAIALALLMTAIYALSVCFACGQQIDISDFNNQPTLDLFTTNATAFAIVEDKRFDNFTFSGSIPASDVQVFGLTSGNPFADPGLFFSSPNPPPNDYILGPNISTGAFTLGYDVTVTDPTMRIKDNLVEIGAPAPPQGANPGPGNFAQITEDVFNPIDLANPIASKFAFSNEFGDQIIDTADFTPLTSIHVETNGLVVNTGSQPPAFIQTFSQTFSQLQVVPEPSALAAWVIMGAVLLTLPLARRGVVRRGG